MLMLYFVIFPVQVCDPCGRHWLPKSCFCDKGDDCDGADLLRTVTFAKKMFVIRLKNMSYIKTEWILSSATQLVSIQLATTPGSPYNMSFPQVLG